MIVYFLFVIVNAGIYVDASSTNAESGLTAGARLKTVTGTISYESATGSTLTFNKDVTNSNYTK